MKRIYITISVTIVALLLAFGILYYGFFQGGQQEVEKNEFGMEDGAWIVLEKEKGILEETKETGGLDTTQVVGENLGAKEKSSVDLILGEIQGAKEVTLSEPFELRVSAVQINDPILTSQTLFPGSLMRIRLFEDVTYNVELVKSETDQFGTISLIGKLKGYDYAEFVLSTRSGVTLATLVDRQNRRIYSIRYLTDAQVHYVVEIDMDKIPVSQDHLPPIVVP